MRLPGLKLLLLPPALAILAASAFAEVPAHEVIFKGTVVKVDGSNIEVNTVDDKARQKRVSFLVTERTKIQRGTRSVTLADARIALKERIVVTVDHSDEAVTPTKALRVQLAPKP